MVSDHVLSKFRKSVASPSLCVGVNLGKYLCLTGTVRQYILLSVHMRRPVDRCRCRLISKLPYYLDKYIYEITEAKQYEDLLRAMFGSRFDYFCLFEKIKFSSCDLYFLYLCMWEDGRVGWCCVVTNSTSVLRHDSMVQLDMN